MTDRERLDVVVPAFNESAGLPLFHQRLGAVLDGLELSARVIYVDDGSCDETWQVMTALAAADPRVAMLRLSRNFGKELALTAGLDYADADAVVVIDADLQDPPELIPQFIARWREGFDVVYGTRGERLGETWAKKASAAAFYRLIGRISATAIPADTGDFRLLGRRAHQALKGLRERQRFMKGLFAWVGFRQTAVVYQRDPRHAGNSAFNFRKLWTFAVDGITSFSVAPLKLATWTGMVTALAAFGFGTWVVVKALLFGDPVAGYPSLMAVLLFLGGIQLLALGIIGEYLGRLYMESKQRPLYLLDAVEPAGNDPGAHPGA
jgi:glycosyltransferase involved in cell wall biosynthesis